VTRDAHRELAEVARDCGHAVIAQSPMDVNLAKDLNVRLTKLLPADRIVIDPLTSSLGYGLEYSYSTMERIRLAAIVHDDRMLQMPIIGRVGKEAWKTKEASQDMARGVWWEAFTAATLLLAGADLVTMRHPDSLALVKTLTH
jgi:acetyl-CoA decarbonylase/synthase complex subunit delta